MLLSVSAVIPIGLLPSGSVYSVIKPAVVTCPISLVA